MGIATGHGGRIDVAPDLSVPGLTGVYALGDFANIAGKDGKPLPQLASVAQQSGHGVPRTFCWTLRESRERRFAIWIKASWR